MAIAFKIGVGDLLLEFSAHTFIFLKSVAAAGAIASRFL
jgi:hypothetical protein